LADETHRSSEAVYLLARLCPHDECLKLMDEAARGNSPSHLAENALGYHALAEGRFDDAVKWGRKAAAGAPGNPFFEHQYEQALWAARAYDELLRQSEIKLAGNREAHGERLRQANVLVAKGDVDGGRRKLDELFAAVGPEGAALRKVLTDG